MVVDVLNMANLKGLRIKFSKGLMATVEFPQHMHAAVANE
jgi:hypothetical protein